MATLFSVLSGSIKTKLEAVSGVDIVRVGTWNTGEMVAEMAAGINRTRIEFLLSNSPRSYVDQREQDRIYQYTFFGHKWIEIVDRIDGTDMFSIEELGAAIASAMYGFTDDIQQGSPEPCTGFLGATDGCTVVPMYQAFDEHLNSVTVEIGFTVGATDTDS